VTLGQVLKEGRTRRGMSLREVERGTGISNGYLSLLESDSVKSPSPNHLHQLAQVYGVSYSLLMELVGYVVPAPPPDPASWQHLDGIDDLTEDERSQVRNFVRFLRSNRQSPEGE
jgi:transcriptional regulator with XRE-family HTH domain